MLKSDEILNSLNSKMNVLDSIADLVEKESLLEECKELKNEYKLALEDEANEKLEIENKKGDVRMENMELMELRAKEEKQFMDYIKGFRNDLKAGDNGAIIPQTISERIIKKIYEVSPVLAKMTVFNEGGDLIFVREAGEGIQAGYQEEMVAFGASDVSFEVVKLQDHLVGALSRVSKSLVNRTTINVVDFVVQDMAEKIAMFLEKEILNGGEKIKGLSEAKTVQVNAMNSDALLDAIMAVPAQHQNGAVFIMHPEMFATFRKLKDGQNRYLFNPDPRMAFGYELIGKEVLLSEQAPKDAFYFGDLKGLYGKFAKGVEVEVLHERFADMYAIGRN